MRGHFLEIHHALGVGLFVDTIDAGGDGGGQVRGHRFIGGQHELFDDAVGDVARGTADAGHGAPFVELDQRLGHVEIDRAAAHALAIHQQRQFPHQLEALDQRLVALALGGIAFEHKMNIGVSHPLDAADHAGGELLRHGFTASVDFEQR